MKSLERSLFALALLAAGAAGAAAACSSSSTTSDDDDGGIFGTHPAPDASGTGGNPITADGSPGFDSGVHGDATSGNDTGSGSDAPHGDSASGPNGRLVINEVDYDEVNSDSAEYVEIYNPSATDAVPLAGLALTMVAGAPPAEYGRIDLSTAGASLPPHGYLVVAAPGVDVSDAGAVLVLRFSAQTNNIQNGRANAAALGVLDTSNDTLLDALSYGGSVTSPLDFVEGAPTTATDSNDAGGALARSPNGVDTGNAANDWKFTTTITPGASNVQTP